MFEKNPQIAIEKAMHVNDALNQKGFHIAEIKVLSLKGLGYFKFVEDGALYVCNQNELSLPQDIYDPVRIWIFADTESYILVEATDHPTVEDFIISYFENK